MSEQHTLLDAPLTFNDFGLHDEVLLGLKDMGFESPTPVQSLAIPIILDGNDLIACAQTGTGKTAAFLIPTIDILDGIPGEHIKCLILCPTRELAMQIDKECEGLTYHTYVGSMAIYGGNKGGDDFARQKAAIVNGADIVIATPGRLLQHIGLGYVDLSKVEFLILDEADRMLDMGFMPDINRILSYIPTERQSLLFSATMPPKIRELAQQILNKPKEISLKVSKPAEKINQSAYCVHDDQKVPLVCHLLLEKKVESVIIFASRKTSVDRIVRALQKQGLDVRGMHSDRDQTERETIMNDFKNKKFPVLVATDILSRGIDIDELSHVINYDVPPDPEDYVHRIGRTARADAKGEAITFINVDDMMRFGRIERLIEREIPKEALPQGYQPGPEYNPKMRGGGGGRMGSGGRGGSFGGRSGGRGDGKFRGGKPQSQPRPIPPSEPREQQPQAEQGDQAARKKNKRRKKGRGPGSPRPEGAPTSVQPKPQVEAATGSSGDAGTEQPVRKKKNVRWRKKGPSAPGGQPSAPPNEA